MVFVAEARGLFFFQAEDGIRDHCVTGVQTCALPIYNPAAMGQFKALTQSATKGQSSLQVGVVLPDTTSSTRYTDFDAPDLKATFLAAGYTTSQFRIENAQGSDATQLSMATADINQGAKVLIVDPIDGPSGVAVAKLAESKGVKLIS